MVSKTLQRKFDELPAQASAAAIGFDGEVGDVTDPRLAVLPSCDAADDPAVDLGHEDAAGIACNVVVQLPSFPPLPIVSLDCAKELLHPLVDRHAVECSDGDTLERRQVVGLIRTNQHGGDWKAEGGRQNVGETTSWDYSRGDTVSNSLRN